MKMFNLFSFFSILLFVASCGDKEERTVELDDTVATEMEYQDPDEAVENWATVWNSNDPAQIQAHTAEDVVVVLNGTELPKDSIGAFIQASGTAMKDLKMISLKKGSSENIAYDTGTYSHTYSTDSTTQYRGSYTFIWERSNDENEWKVKAMNISNVQPEE